MGIIDRLKSLAKTEIKLFSRTNKPEHRKIKEQLINTGAIPRTDRDNIENALNETYKGDQKSIDYGLYLWDQAELDRQKKETERKIKSLALDGEAAIQNRYQTDVTETADEGIYGYSTRDEVRQARTDSEIQRWLKDPKVKASFQILSAQVFSDPLVMEQQGSNDESVTLKEYMDTCIDEQDGSLRKTLKEGLVVGLSFQNAFFEKISGWSENPDFIGKRIYQKYASKRSGLFEFITDDTDNVKAIHSLINFDDYYSPSRFLIIDFNNMFSNPYGQTLFAGTYKFWKAKLLVYQEMAIYANRYSQPIPTVTYDDPDQEAKAQELSNKLYSGLNIALPEGVKAEYLSALESGADPFIPMLEYFDKQISLGICGIDLSQGSYAADKVIADERSLLVKDIREDIEEIVYEQIIKPLCKQNFDNDIYTIKNYPRCKFKRPKSPLTAAELTQAIPVLSLEGIIYPDRLADKNKIRTFFDFDEIQQEENTDEYIEVDDDIDEFDEVETLGDVDAEEES